MYFSILTSSVIIIVEIYSHICHRRPIATPCYILLWGFLALVFALMSGEGVVETVQHLIKGFSEQIAKKPLFGAVSEDFIKAL